MQSPVVIREAVSFDFCSLFSNKLLSSYRMGYIMVNIGKSLSVLLLSLFLLTACSVSVVDNASTQLLDSLCSSISENRYKNPQTVYWLATELSQKSEPRSEYNSIALNSLAYAAFMRMDYAEAIRLYNSVDATSRCEVERLIANVGMMTLCYRTSANRDFFDYRTAALRSVERIEEEFELLPEDEKERFLQAKVELDIVSICYFSNIGIENELLASIEKLKADVQQITDVPLRIYARMMLNVQPTLTLTERAESLSLGFERAHKNGLLWLKANYRLLLAIMLRDNLSRNYIEEEMPSLIAGFSVDSLVVDDLPLSLAINSAREFNLYGDRYMAIEALAVAASCNTQQGQFDEALLLLDDAMNWINNYYSGFYPDDSLNLLSIDLPDDSEIERIESDSIINIAECLLSVRREASCAYAGVGDKYLSDINRNSYLDLLTATRLNKQMESSAEFAEYNAKRLYAWALVAVVTFIVVALCTYFMNRQWRRRSAEYTADLRRILNLCRQLMLALPQELSDKEAVYSAVEGILDNGLSNFSGDTKFSFSPIESDGYNYTFPIAVPGDSCQEALYLSTLQPLSKEKYSLVEIAVPYIVAALEEGMRIANIGDAQQEIEQQRISYAYYLAERKRENLLKRVSTSVVGSMRPFMDRMLNELRHLVQSPSRGDVEQLRMQYLAELTERLDECNIILERWIKMRRGDFSLHIENFTLAELFEIIKQGAQTIELKGIEFDVKSSYAVVKADKALTLFMINTLADNASKFTPIGGRVTIEAVEAENFVEIAVCDTGDGIEQCDIDKILNEKVYDASQIGCDAALAKNKGGGFGLMNCKGIIEKYRSTDALFGVCRMDIKSVVGKGSRFSFRLPKGVLRIILPLLLFVPLSLDAESSVFERVGILADSVYQYNVDGCYREALQCARVAIDELNNYYRANVGGNDTLSFSSGASNEIRWWRQSLFPDSISNDIYYNLLDIRNEVAVASLALQQWDCYRYNNNIYALLYRLVHEDKNIGLHYNKMQRVANYRQAAIVLCITLLLVLAIVYALSYVRHGIVERMNTQMLLDINKRLLGVTGGVRSTAIEMAQSMADEIFAGMREMLRIKRVAIMLKGADGAMPVTAWAADVDEMDEGYLRRAFESGELRVLKEGLLRVFPLVAHSSGEKIVIGAVAVEAERSMTEGEIMTVELVIGYAASAAYHQTVRLAEKYRMLDDIQEQMERVRYEESRLHVQNQVMDNCLSMIKHETIYYPGRIRTLIEELRREDTDNSLWASKITTMRELMEYYNSIFGVLSACAMRQLDDYNFVVSKVPLAAVWKHLQQIVKRRSSKENLNIELCCESTEAVACGDSDLIYMLFESLLDAALAFKKDGRLILRAREEGSAVCVEFIDTRRHFTADELSELFVPSRRNIAGEGLVGIEYLVAKEIVRMHEDNMGRRGERMEARDSAQGMLLFFTLPK